MIDFRVGISKFGLVTAVPGGFVSPAAGD